MELPKVFEGTIVHGFGRGGSVLGYPTANICTTGWKAEIDEDDEGVYCGYSFIDGEYYPSVISIGPSPTFKAGEPAFEVHLLDYNNDIYGRVLKVEVTDRIRGMLKFNSLDELKAAITNDTTQARRLLSGKTHSLM